jgi:hypothetical protein
MKQRRGTCGFRAAQRQILERDAQRKPFDVHAAEFGLATGALFESGHDGTASPVVNGSAPN